MDLLFDLIAMRLVTSVTLSALRRQQTGDNPYLAISEAPAWRMLRRLDAMNPRFATAILRHACGFDAAPGARSPGFPPTASNLSRSSIAIRRRWSRRWFLMATRSTR